VAQIPVASRTYRLVVLRVQITQETAMKEAIEGNEKAERDVAITRERLSTPGIDPDA
jgi:hypothetical protein